MTATLQNMIVRLRENDFGNVHRHRVFAYAALATTMPRRGYKESVNFFLLSSDAGLGEAMTQPLRVEVIPAWSEPASKSFSDWQGWLVRENWLMKLGAGASTATPLP